MTARTIHLAAHFPGVNNTTVWSDPRSGSHIEFDSFAHMAKDAERAKFDFLFLAEGLRLREQAGRIYDRDVMGRPDTFTVLAALAAVTDRLGLVGTINSTFTEPYEVARQFATLDHLSAGRAGWNVVTSWDSFIGENFRRGDYLPYEQRYERAERFLATARTLFRSWPERASTADLLDGEAGRFACQDSQFDIRGRFTVPRSPQNGPVIFQAGSSPAGREFAAKDADAIFCVDLPFARQQEFCADVKERAVRHGRAPDSLLVLPSATFVVAPTDTEAGDQAHEIRQSQVSGDTARLVVEELWNTDLSAYDPDGPLPELDPVVGKGTASGLASIYRYPDPIGTARTWRAKAEAEGLSMRQLVIELTARQTFVGSPETVARRINQYVQEGACDGFILVPHLSPGGFGYFADEVVPILQSWGVFRTDYEGPTLRDHLAQRPSPVT